MTNAPSITDVSFARKAQGAFSVKWTFLVSHHAPHPFASAPHAVTPARCHGGQNTGLQEVDYFFSLWQIISGALTIDTAPLRTVTVFTAICGP